MQAFGYNGPMNIQRMDFQEIAQAAQLIGRYQAQCGIPAAIPEVEDYLFVQLSREDAFCFLVWPDHTQDGAPIGFMQVIPMMEALRCRSYLKATDLFCFQEGTQSVNELGISLLLDAACELVQFRGDHGLVISVSQAQEALSHLCKERGWAQLENEVRYFNENKVPVPIP